MNFTWFIARRYLWSKHKTRFISVISSIAMSGVAIGTAALIITLCIMAGFKNSLQEKFIGFDAHLRLKTFEESGLINNYRETESQLRSIEGVNNISPYIEKEAMIRSSFATDGVLIKGVLANKADSVLAISKHIVALADTVKGFGLQKRHDKNLPEILIGQKLAERLKVKVGDKVTVFILQSTLAFVQQPTVRQFKVAYIYRSGLAEYDNVLAYIHLEEAQTLFQYGDCISGFEISVKSLDETNAVSKDINSKFTYPLYCKTWQENHRNLFGWLESNNFVMFIIFSLILMVAAFNTIGTLFIIVIEKTKEIGILKAMGATKGTVRQIFLRNGIWIGVIGALGGSALALFLCWIQLEFRIISLKSDVYFMDTVPIELHWYYFVLVSVVSIFLCAAAALIPARRAASLDPAQAIRYE